MVIDCEREIIRIVYPGSHVLSLQLLLINVLIELTLVEKHLQFSLKSEICKAFAK